MRTNFDNNPLIQKCIAFSVAMINYCEMLEANKKFIIARQLLRSATSIGANAMEAQSAESKTDFIHKLKISDKEAFETWYWFQLCKAIPTYNFDIRLESELHEIMNIINAIILSTKKSIQKP